MLYALLIAICFLVHPIMGILMLLAAYEMHATGVNLYVNAKFQSLWDKFRSNFLSR